MQPMTNATTTTIATILTKSNRRQLLPFIANVSISLLANALVAQTLSSPITIIISTHKYNNNNRHTNKHISINQHQP